MILAVASGKGGTGKTTVSANLASVYGTEVMLLDCDVEEPNAHLFIQGVPVSSDIVSTPVPEVDETLCDGCGECSGICQFHALVSFGGPPMVFPEMCHGCGGCILVCPKGALREAPKRIGTVDTFRADHISLVQGRLDVGVAMAPPLIRAVKERIRRQSPAILDAPPGTSCPVISTLRGADAVLLVTEPTPFGLHDLKLAVEMVRELGLPFGVVVNRAGVGDDRVHTWCSEQDVPILLEIPYDRRIAEVCSRGELIVEALPQYRDLFTGLLDRVNGLPGETRLNRPLFSAGAGKGGAP